MKAVLAIDPGARGGIAVITDKKIIRCDKCPNNISHMSIMINRIVKNCHEKSYNLEAYIEKVHAFPTDARNSAFKFGMNYGMWLGILASNDIIPTKVSPKKWQKKFQPLSKLKKERKKELRQLATKMFPKVKVTYMNCDALLIANYGLNYDRV